MGRSRILPRVVATISSAAFLFFVPSAVADVPSELLRASAAFQKALRDADASALSAIVDDRFIWITADGAVFGKSDLLGQLRGHASQFGDPTSEQEAFRQYGNTAVVTGCSKRKLASAATTVDLRYTLTFAKVRRNWKAVAYHEGRIAPGADKPLQVRLGYPADAKLLILNADDLAVTHSEDVASFAALDQKWITSGTVMVPCPWFTEVAAYAKSHPEADLGLHLTFTSEWDSYRWGPVTPRALVPSLVGPDGYFYADAASLLKHARLDEVETELRAQIELAKSMGLEPTHLDAHMHVLYASPELFGIFQKVARAYKLPIRMARNDQLFASKIERMDLHDPIPDAIFSPGNDVLASQWTDYYVNLMKNLQPGVTEVFVHLAHDDAETQAVMVNHPDWGAAWRQREFEAMSSPAFRQALEDNHVILIGWREIKKLL